MYIKILAYSLVAALLMTGTAAQVSSISGQGAQSPALAVTSAATLTEAEATAIALEHAGFTADQVSFLNIEPELLDRSPHYDVEFREGRWEYELEIHAETGAVLSFEKDD